MYQLAQAFKAEQPGSGGGSADHAPSKYTSLRQALDNRDRAGAEAVIRALLNDSKSLHQVSQALGLRNSGAQVEPELFTGSRAGDLRMFHSLTRAQRAVYTQAQ